MVGGGDCEVGLIYGWGRMVLLDETRILGFWLGGFFLPFDGLISVVYQNDGNGGHPVLEKESYLSAVDGSARQLVSDQAHVDG